MKGLPAAIAYLTRIPMPAGAHSPELRGAALPWFPVVGAGIGALVGGIAWLGVAVNLPPLAAASLGVGAGMAATGAFHEDGLADACDGLGAGGSPSRMLEKMRDPRLGTFGTAALVVSLILQISALAALPAGMVIPVAAAAHSSSRSWPAAAMFLPSASPDGLAASLRQATGRWARVLCLLFGLVIAAGLLRGAAWALLPAGAAGAMFVWLTYKRLGGVTGDILGAVQQITLVAVLLFAAAWWNG